MISRRFAVLNILFVLSCDGLRSESNDDALEQGRPEAGSSSMVETSSCTKKTYYFQVNNESPMAIELHTADATKERVLHIYPGQSWALETPRTGKLWDRGRMYESATGQWDLCWPRWWEVDYVDKSGPWNGCQHTSWKGKVMNLEPLESTEGQKTIELKSVMKISFHSEDGEDTSDSISVEYNDESTNQSQSLTFVEGKYYPERVLKTLLRDVTDHNTQEREKVFDKRFSGKEYEGKYKQKPEIDGLTSTGATEYFQGAEQWMENGFRGVFGQEFGLLGLGAALTGGTLGLTARAPLAIWNKVKEDRELQASAAAKLFQKLASCSTYFKKCSSSEYVAKHGGVCS